MSNIYLAASYKDKRRMRAIRDELEKLGHNITSDWIDQTGGGIDRFETAADRQQANLAATRDWAGVIAADEIVVFTDLPSSTGGFYVELGIAIALPHKIIVIVGPRKNIFMYMAGIIHFPDSYQYLKAMEARHGSSSPQAVSTEHREAGEGATHQS